MFKHYGFLNFILIIAILLLFLKNYETWTKQAPNLLIKEASKRSESKVETSPLASPSRPKSDASSFTTIAEKNIFHPERKDFISLNPEQPRAMPLNRPQVQLQGILITEEVQRASLILQGKSLPKGEKASRILNLGDQIGEYKLTKIFPDRIVLEGSGDVYEVFLYDLKSPKKRRDIRTPSRPAETIRPSPGSSVAVPRAPSPLPPSPPPPLGTTREIQMPSPQPPLPPGSPVGPGSTLTPARKPPLPEIRGGER